MPMSATARPHGLGPSTDPGDLGWYAQGLGVDLPGGLGLLGNYSAAQRNRMLHSQDAAAGLDAGTLAQTNAANATARQNADSYMAALESGQASGGNEDRMLASMDSYQRAAWTGQGDPGNYVRVGNTIVPRTSAAQGPANPSREVSLADFYAGLGGGTAAGGGGPRSPLHARPVTTTAAGSGNQYGNPIVTGVPPPTTNQYGDPISGGGGTPVNNTDYVNGGLRSAAGGGGGVGSPGPSWDPTNSGLVKPPAMASGTDAQGNPIGWNWTEQGGWHQLTPEDNAPDYSPVPNPRQATGAVPNPGAGGSGGGVPGSLSGDNSPSNMPITTYPTDGPITASGTGEIIGSSANYWDPAYGGVPNVPDPVSSQFQATQGNLSNLGSITQLAGGINAFGAQQARGQYEANLPGYNQMTGQASNDIIAELEGQVPQDVINNLQQSAAERGIGTAGGGGPNAGAQYLKALGLTSLGQKQLGQQNLTAAIQRTPTSPLFNVASMMVSPNDEQAARMAANLYAAAPDPRSAAMEAMARAREGLGAGAGGGGGQTINPAGIGPGSGVFPGNNVAPFQTYPTVTSTGGGGGQTGGFTQTGNPYTNWQNWFNNLQTGTGAGSYDPYGLGGQDPWSTDVFGNPINTSQDGGGPGDWFDSGTGQDQYGLIYDQGGGSYDPWFGE